MTTKKRVIEKQLIYSGFEENWIKDLKKTEQDSQKWETVCEQLGNEDIVYSFIYGLQFNMENAIFATNNNLQIIFNSVFDERVEKKIYKYADIKGVKILNDKKSKYILSIATISKTLNFEIDNLFLAIHIRKTILNEIYNTNEIDEIKKNTDFVIAKNHEKGKKEIEIVEDQIAFEPIALEPKHRSFDDNFLKIKNIYHVRRIIGGLLISWFITYLICLFYNVWAIKDSFAYTPNSTDYKTIVPFFVSVLGVALISLNCGTLIYFYIYQRHLKNKIINLLCLILFACYSFNASSQIVMDSFYQVFIFPGNKSHSVVKTIKSLQCGLGIFNLIVSFFTFAPLIILNYGIHHKVK